MPLSFARPRTTTAGSATGAQALCRDWIGDLRDLRYDAPSPEERLLWEGIEGLVTRQRCCLDCDGDGAADDGLLVIGVPPDG